MKVSSFISKMTEMPRLESLNRLTEEEKETYSKLKEKVVELNPVEIEYSRLFENRFIKGNIAISIDPIDYLLMSVNKSGWDSCYRLTNSSGNSRSFGAYASGVFCYLCDSSTMITYRHSNDMAEFKIGSSKFEAYSKNWRQVFYVDVATWGFACSRQYPYEDNNLSKSVREFLEETLSNYLDVQNKWKFKEIEETSKLERMIIREEPIKGNRLSYNDILNNGFGIFVANPYISKTSDICCYVDSNPICPICGENVLDKSGVPACRDCRSKEGM